MKYEHRVSLFSLFHDVKRLAVVLLAAPLLLSACGGGGGGSSNSNLAAPADFKVAGYSPKGYQFSWTTTPGATSYQLFEDPDGSGPQPEAQVGGSLIGTGTSYSLAGQLLYKLVNATYRLRACDANGCGAFTTAITPDLTQAIGYFKASGSSHWFGSSLALSSDGSTMAVGAQNEAVYAAGSTDAQASDVAYNSGAVYIFARSADNRWSQQARLTASYTGTFTWPDNFTLRSQFGASLALSADGNTLAVGAPREPSNARGVNGDQTNTATRSAGAVYVFGRSSNAWSQQAYVKSPNTPESSTAGLPDIVRTDVIRPYHFGTSVSLSADGNLLAVGAPGETGDNVGSNPSSATVGNVGAVYTYARSNAAWAVKDYLKTDSTANSYFGKDLALSGDGKTLAVAGSKPYVLAQDSSGWSPQTVPGSSVWQTSARRIALSSDGNTLAVGALSNQTGDNATRVAVVYARSQNAWSEQVALQLGVGPYYDFPLVLSGDGNTLAVGDYLQPGGGTGLNSSPTDNSAPQAGAAYLWQRNGTQWSQRAFIKASNTKAVNWFGYAIALSADGTTLAVGAPYEGKATGIEGDQTNNPSSYVGAVYLY